MIKYFCDRCGVEMTKEKRHGYGFEKGRVEGQGHCR